MTDGEMDYEPLTRDKWVCRICRRPLDPYQRHDDDGTVVNARWIHPSADRPADHDPDPVPLEASGGEMVGTCDFSSDPGPTWRYPCGDFAVPWCGSVGDWAACDACHDLIERGVWTAVAGRAVAKYPEALRRGARREVDQIHRLFRKHRIGDAVREP